MDVDILSMSSSMPSGIHVSKLAFDRSRPNSDADLADVLNMDAPVNELPSVLLDVKSTIVEREVIIAIHEHSMWASGSRLDKIWEFKIDSSLGYESNSFADTMRRRMKGRIDRGVPQDQFRMCLPLTAMTRYIVRLNLRACSALSNYFAHLATLHTETYDLFMNASDKFKEVASAMGLNKLYKFVELLGQPNYTWNHTEATTIGSFTFVRYTAPFALRTHVSRHRRIFIHDNLKLWIKNGVHTKCLEDEMTFEAVATNSAWLNVYSRRSCWLAQADLWDDFLRVAVNSISPGDSILPCSDGVCPFAKDAMLRLEEGKDPNAPCPRYARLNNIVLTDGQLDLVKREIKLGKRHQYWEKYIE